MVEGRTDEAEAVFGRADYWGFEGVGGRCEGCGSLPQARHFGRDLLQLEGEVWRDGHARRQAAEGFGPPPVAYPTPNGVTETVEAPIAAG